MADQLTISTNKIKLPDQDFQRLRSEGLQHIQDLASRLWTDYNTHDPGITILEVLCYAITDLGYRCEFPVEEILASDPSNKVGSTPDFFKAREILPNQPVTLKDFRKILVDLPEVRNAWLEKSDESEQKIYFNEQGACYEKKSIGSFVKSQFRNCIPY